jgi:predicted metal-dependent peptidase
MTTTTSPALPELDFQFLDRELDKTKTRLFLGKRAAFLGPLMSTMNFSWVEDIETACTNGVILWWNPRFFLDLIPEVRMTILTHELWHPARLDMLRCGDRDPEIWNYACDILINNGLIREGYSFKGFQPWFNFDYEGWVTEDVYDDLVKKRDEILAQLGPGGQSPQMPWQQPWLINPRTGKADKSDLVEPEETDVRKALEHTILSNVLTAVNSAGMGGGGGAGDVPGETELVLKRFLQPKLPWDRLLHRFFNQLHDQHYSLKRPNRRYPSIYLPSLVDEEEGALDHLIYYLDVSGSISDGQILRFHSEFKYVKEYYQPEKMTMAQFDVVIQKEEVFLKEDPFEETHVLGRGGTSLVCVRDHIIKHRPTAVVIFSDLCCEPMEPLPKANEVPIIWVALNASSAKVPHGTIIHLQE